MADRGWKLRPVDASLVEPLARALSLSPFISRLLVMRGVSAPDDAKRFLEPRLADLTPPTGLADLSRGVERLIDARKRDEVVAVFGDYDVDGVTSAALLGDYLGGAGFQVSLRVARRDEGYGFGLCQAEELRQRGAGLVILCDCGTSDLEAVSHLAKADVDVIVLDHHRVPQDVIWPGYALINPQRPDDGFPFKGLCTAGLAFYVMAALRRKLVACGYPALDPRETLDLVALGTVADVAPLRDDNRILVARGLEVLGRTKRPGLQELMRLGEIVGRQPTVRDVGWRIGPRLNAPGRLGDADVALQCLYQRQAGKAAEQAQRCDQLNDQRKEIQGRILDEALAQAESQGDRSFIVVAGDSWHPGVIGIVAGRLAEQFSRPAAVVAMDGDAGRGSARSVEGIDLFAALSGASGHLLRYGGHAAAAGFSVARDQLGALRDVLHQYAAPLLGGLGTSPVVVDIEVPLGDVDFALIDELDTLGPYGAENPEPILLCRSLKVRSSAIVGNNHLKLTVVDGVTSHGAIGFGLGSRKERCNGLIDLAFRPVNDEFRGRRVSLHVVDLWPSDAGA